MIGMRWMYIGNAVPQFQTCFHLPQKGDRQCEVVFVVGNFKVTNNFELPTCIWIYCLFALRTRVLRDDASLSLHLIHPHYIAKLHIQLSIAASCQTQGDGAAVAILVTHTE